MGRDGQVSSVDVIVVGAGLAGLRCASVLERDGYDVTVLEAADRVGGRVATDEVDGFLVDRGFQVLNPAYPALTEAVDLTALDLRPYAAGVLVRTDDGLRTAAHPAREPRLIRATLTSGLLGVREVVGLAPVAGAGARRPATLAAGSRPRLGHGARRPPRHR